jgi:cobalamin synthase
MGLFFRRFIGVLALDASMFEEIEADSRASLHAVAAVIAAAGGGRIAAIELGLTKSDSFIVVMMIALGAVLVWITAVAAIGIYALAQPQTHSNMRELLRTVGFAAAPGVFLAFAAIQPVAPVVVGIVLMWTIATTVMAVRQSLDYRDTWRAVAVCVLAAALSIGSIAALIAMFGRSVS